VLDGATEIPSSGPGEPRRGKYITQAEREKRYRMENPQSSSMFDMNPSGSTDMARGVAGIGEAALSLGSGMVAAPVAGLAGTAVAPFNGQKAADVVTRIQDAMTYQPRTEAGQQATAVATYPFEKLAQAGNAVGERVADATGSPALGAAANTAVQAVPAVLARGTLRRGSRSVDRPGTVLADKEAAPRPAAPAQAGRNAGLESVPEKSPVPSIEELQKAKDAAYKKAEETGVVVSRSALNRLKIGLVGDLKKEGLNRKLHPKAAAALEEIVNTKGQLTLSEIETLRKIANDAKGSLEPADARLGARIVDRIDDFEETLGESDVVSGSAESATAFKEARALNTRLAKSRIIQKLFDDAELQAKANYTIAGMETALRQQFRSLAKNDRKMRGFTPEEKAAIRKVAMGGPVENALRKVGKFAPEGVISTYGALGAAMVNPAFGAIPLAGGLSKIAATKMTMRNARSAQDLIRRGPEKEKSPNPEVATAQ
jgi:hypothetical protein